MSSQDFPPSAGFKKIYNFRSLRRGESDKLRFFRCASVSCATEADCKILMNKYNILTIVDLRGVGGKSSNVGPNKTLKYYPRIEDGNGKGRRRTLTFDLFTADTKRRIRSRLYTLNSAKVFFCAVLTFCFYTIMRIALFTFPKYTRDWKLYFIARHLKWTIQPYCNVEDGGPLGVVYQCMLEGSKEVICRVLKTIAEPINCPRLFHCASGKDRTGLIAMLVMASIGCTRREIVEDYYKSEEFSVSATHYRLIGVSDTTNKYLDKGTLKQLGAPKHAMQAALNYLDKKYNGPCNYLDSIGFTQEWRDKLKD